MVGPSPAPFTSANKSIIHSTQPHHTPCFLDLVTLTVSLDLILEKARGNFNRGIKTPVSHAVFPITTLCGWVTS